LDDIAHPRYSWDENGYDELTKTTKNTTIDKVLQGVASLGSERPEECNAGAVSLEDHPKTRVRYSGAARRRYKKQLQREREATKAQTLPLKLILVLGPVAMEPRLWRLNAPDRGQTPLVPSKLARANDPRSMIKGHMPKRRACQTSPHFGGLP